MPHDPTNVIDNSPAGNAPEMTDAERAALNLEAPAGDPPPTDPVDPPKPEETPPQDPVPEPQPAPPPAPFVATPTAPAARDFDKELGAISADLQGLRKRLNEGEIDDDQYFSEFERLQGDRTNLLVAKGLHEQAVQTAVAGQEQAWDYMVQRFLEIPENAAIGGSAMLTAAWEVAMQEAINGAAAQGKQLTDWELMQAGRARLADEGLLAKLPATQSQPAQSSQPTAPPERNPPLGTVPQQLSGAPSAADPGPRAGAEELAGLSAEDLEARLAGMSEAARDQLLRGTPGTFVG